MKTWYYEVYTKNPTTGEGGWDIETGWVQAENYIRAKAKIRNTIANFDIFISCYEANMNVDDKLTIT